MSTSKSWVDISGKARRLFFIMGTFEFYTAYKFFTDAESFSGHGQMVDSSFATNPCVRMLFSVYMLTLGLQRLQWYYGTESSHNMFQWLCLLLTHVVEAIMWWVFADAQGLLGRSLASVAVDEVPLFLYDLVTLQTPVQLEHLALLIGVPVLCLRIFTTPFERQVAPRAGKVATD
jgi:hypothetical protein